MNLRFVEAFYWVASLKSISRAAEKLFLTQSAMSSRIATLTEHFKSHKKDNHSRRGLLKMVALRRKLLDYVKKNDEPRYQSLLERLNIRR